MIFDTVGNKENPAIVMLNGSFTVGSSLLPIAKQLADKYFVVMPTYDGHHANGGEFSTRQEQARKVLAYLKQQGVRRIAVLQGASMGAEIALDLAAALHADGGIQLDRCFFDGGPFFSFPWPMRMLMRGKFKGIVRMARTGTPDEIVEKLSANKMVKWMAKGDMTPYASMIRDIAQSAPHMTPASVEKESDACYTFDFPRVPESEQRKYVFSWSDNEPAAKSKKTMMARYPHAAFESAGSLGHCGFLCRKPDEYAARLRSLADNKA